MTILAIGTAFIGGLVSFLSPCVLPIVPGFLAYLAGSSTDDRQPSGPSRRAIFLSSVYFVLGFSIVFALLGVLLNTVLIHVAGGVQTWLSRIGGAVVIFFGLYLVGLLHVGMLDREHTFKVQSKSASQPLVSFLFGLAFAAGWTPCVGPVLGVILGLAASAPSSAFILLLSYAIGLGVPFLIVGAFTAQAASFISQHGRAFKVINKFFGIFLIILGILVFTGTLALVGNFGFLNNLILH